MEAVPSLGLSQQEEKLAPIGILKKDVLLTVPARHGMKHGTVKVNTGWSGHNIYTIYPPKTFRVSDENASPKTEKTERSDP